MARSQLISATLAARAALPRYGLAADTTLSLLKQRENVVFLAETSSSAFVLRVHRRGHRTNAELANEIEFVHTLHRHGVPVPRFVQTQDKRSFCMVSHEADLGEYQVDLQHWLINSGDFGDERTAVDGTSDLPSGDFEQLGLLIARLHDASEHSGTRFSAKRAAWDRDGLVGTSPVWGDPLRLTELTTADRAELRRAMAKIHKALSVYGNPAHRYGAIHADLTPENVLRTPDGLALIDFDDYASGWHLFDLATAIYFYTPHPQRNEYQHALFSGYESLRPLSEADHQVFPALLLARGLTYLGWAADRRGEPTAEWQASTVLPHMLVLARNFNSTSEH